MTKDRKQRWPLTAWLEVPRPEEPNGWLRVLCMGTYRTVDELPPGDELEERAERLAERNGVSGGYRWALDFNGGATRPR